MNRFFFCLLLATCVLAGAALPFYFQGVRFESFMLAAMGVVGGCLLTMAVTFVVERGISALFKDQGFRPSDTDDAPQSGADSQITGPLDLDLRNLNRRL